MLVGMGAQPSFAADVQKQPSFATDGLKEHFVEDSTVVYVSQDSISLSATLYMPSSASKRRRVPAVVIMSGTGKQNRDGMMAGHAVFRELAEHLAKNGIAVLCTDDRGTGKSGGIYELATTADFADDALAAVEFLKTVPQIDRKRIGLVGHSEGGASISIAASRSKDVAFMISLAGLMTDGLSSVIQQNLDLIAASPQSDEDKQRYNEINELMFRTAYEYAESDTLDSVLWHRFDDWKRVDTERWNARHAGEEGAFDRFRYSIYMYAMNACTAWYRFFIRYNPGDYLCKVKIPVLAINGDKDIMVNCEQNLQNVQRYLAHNKDVTTVAVPSVNHLLLPCERGTQDEYIHIKDGVAPEILSLVTDWIKKL